MLKDSYIWPNWFYVRNVKMTQVRQRINAVHHSNRATGKCWQAFRNLFTQGIFTPLAQVSNRSGKDKSDFCFGWLFRLLWETYPQRIHLILGWREVCFMWVKSHPASFCENRASLAAGQPFLECGRDSPSSRWTICIWETLQAPPGIPKGAYQSALKTRKGQEGGG